MPPVQDELTSSPRAEPTDHDDIDPLNGFGAHFKEAIAVGRARLSLLIDEGIGEIHGLLARAAIFFFMASLAFIFACLGVYYLVSGSVTGLEAAIGNRWGACLIVGVSGIAGSAALVICQIWHYRRLRMNALRKKFGQPPKANS
jgi:hypothetical protein